MRRARHNLSTVAGDFIWSVTSFFTLLKTFTQRTTLQRKGRWESNINVWFPFMYSQKWFWYFQNRIIMFCHPVPVYFQDRSAYSAAGKYVDRSWEYINRSQTHECGNWDWGCAIPRKGIHKWDFPCSVFYPNNFCTKYKKYLNPAYLLSHATVPLKWSASYAKSLVQCSVLPHFVTLITSYLLQAKIQR